MRLVAAAGPGSGPAATSACAATVGEPASANGTEREKVKMNENLNEKGGGEPVAKRARVDDVDDVGECRW